MTANGTIGLARAVGAGADLSRELDELLRRRLGVADVRDPEKVAEGLRRVYGREAARLDQETQGYAIGGEVNPSARVQAAPPSDTPGSRELRRVREALADDLEVLVSAPANREWKPELQGWRATMHRTLDEGAAAARRARDPARRDAAFLAIRTLNEYARVARLVGVVHLRMNHDYRRFARTLDEGASAIRVLAGEALYDAGLADGGLILSVPVADLRQRGDAVVAALRGLLGLEASGPEDTGENLHGYNMLLRNLDAWGETELAGYLREGTLQEAIDAMVEGVSRAVGADDAVALREIAATLPVNMRPFRRLASVAGNLLPPDPTQQRDDGEQLGAGEEQARSTGVGEVQSAALSRFVQALELFLQSIGRPRQGARLVDLAVPLPIAALQTDEPDGDVRATLRNLLGLRAEYAREADEYLSCVGSQLDDLRTQVRIDMLLQHLDRAIDLIATGGPALDDDGVDPFVRRAAIVGILAVNLSEQTHAPDFEYPAGIQPPNVAGPPAPPVGDALGNQPLPNQDGWPASPLHQLLRRIWEELFTHEPRLHDNSTSPNWFNSGLAGARTMPPSLDPLAQSEMLRMHRDENRWQALVQSLAPRTTRGSRYGRHLLQAGWDLLAYNTNRYAHRQPGEAARSPLGTQASATRRIAHWPERYDVEPILTVVRQLIGGVVPTNLVGVLSADSLRDVRMILDIADHGLGETKREAISITSGVEIWNPGSALQVWRGFRNYLMVGTGSLTGGPTTITFPLRGWAEPPSGAQAPQLSREVGNAFPDLAGAVEALLTLDAGQNQVQREGLTSDQHDVLRTRLAEARTLLLQAELLASFATLRSNTAR